MKAAFIPEVNGELDTQNFEKFDEVLLFTHVVVKLLLFFLCCNTTVFCSRIIKSHQAQNQVPGGRLVNPAMNNYF